MDSLFAAKKMWVVVLCALSLLRCGFVAGTTSKLPPGPHKLLVLPFTGRGPGLSLRSGHGAADQLTAYLFMQGNFPVVDRSQVNDMLQQVEKENVYFLSRASLCALADTLGASVVVLGLIENQPAEAGRRHPLHRLTVTLRFLDGRTGEILHIAQRRAESRAPPAQIIDDLLRALVDEL